jgi:hypothetical protein
LAQGKTLKFAGLFSFFCSVFKEGKRRWPTDTKQKKRMLANRYISFHLLLASLQINVKIAFQNKNKHISWSYSLPVGMFKTKNKR